LRSLRELLPLAFVAKPNRLTPHTPLSKLTPPLRDHRCPQKSLHRLQEVPPLA
jgi:hypothetical protein